MLFDSFPGLDDLCPAVEGVLTVQFRVVNIVLVERQTCLDDWDALTREHSLVDDHGAGQHDAVAGHYSLLTGHFYHVAGHQTCRVHIFLQFACQEHVQGSGVTRHLTDLVRVCRSLVQFADDRGRGDQHDAERVGRIPIMEPEGHSEHLEYVERIQYLTH